MPGWTLAPLTRPNRGRRSSSASSGGKACAWAADASGTLTLTHTLRTHIATCALPTAAPRQPRLDLPTHCPSRAASLIAAPRACRIRSSASPRRLARTCTEELRAGRPCTRLEARDQHILVSLLTDTCVRGCIRHNTSTFKKCRYAHTCITSQFSILHSTRT